MEMNCVQEQTHYFQTPLDLATEVVFYLDHRVFPSKNQICVSEINHSVLTIHTLGYWWLAERLRRLELIPGGPTHGCHRFHVDSFGPDFVIQYYQLAERGGMQ